MADLAFTGGAVLFHDLLNGIHAAEGGQPRIAQGLFDLGHPEVQCTFNPVGHFRHNGFNQRVVCYHQLPRAYPNFLINQVVADQPLPVL